TLVDQPPFHTTFWCADTGFFVFDLRGERAYDKGILVTERQWRDFRHFLEEAAARQCSTIFIIASIPVIHFSPLMTVLMSGLPTELGNDIRDRWSSAPFEREREALLESLFAWERADPHRQAIILSGDVHAGAAFRATAREGRGVIRQWTSSPLTTPTGIGHHLVNWLGSSLVNLGERALRIEREALVFGNNFGVVEVSPLPTGGHSVEYTLYNYLHDSGTIRPATRVTARPTAP
ncbi:MAG TPA: hypothetical protein VGW38_12105, partial [Chloroflexota bacterium]|nr:hypothetical protein [Chloroflexota bacterium]